jgi:hypothetical protein
MRFQNYCDFQLAAGTFVTIILPAASPDLTCPTPILAVKNLKTTYAQVLDVATIDRRKFKNKQRR